MLASELDMYTQGNRTFSISTPYTVGTIMGVFVLLMEYLAIGDVMSCARVARPASRL